ncbi:MAG: hypothetical protein LBS55_09910, partial [Prevotellaceae bacterium]|nr:hypothetical protein [Prevotellaceae bacterium]
MTFVYVLVSDAADTYYEQFLLSLTSFRIFNGSGKVIVLTDRETKRGLSGRRSGYEGLVDGIQTVDVPGSTGRKEISRWIKTSVRDHVTGDFLFIDCDTIVAGLLNAEFPQNMETGAVLDTHIKLPEHHLREIFNGRDRAAGFRSSLDGTEHYNSGVIFCRDNPRCREFYHRWHLLWKEGNAKGIVSDQPSFNEANRLMNGVLSDMGGAWNCQISHNGLPFLHDAKIIHYYATSLVSFESPFLPASAGILNSIKETGS